MTTADERTDLMQDYSRSLLSESVVSLFWAIIAEKRKKEPYPLQRLADAAGIDKSKISRDFAGSPNWRLNTIADLADALGVDIEVRARDRVTGEVIGPRGPEKRAFAVPTSSVASGAQTMRIEKSMSLNRRSRPFVSDKTVVSSTSVAVR